LERDISRLTPVSKYSKSKRLAKRPIGVHWVFCTGTKTEGFRQGIKKGSVAMYSI